MIVLKAVIFGLTATVDSTGSVDSIDMRNSFNPVVMKDTTLTSLHGPIRRLYEQVDRRER